MRPTVLIVDDHEDTVLLFTEELRNAGFDTTGTTSPNEALNLAIALKPDAIVMDIAMPDMDGYELARLVRSYAATRGIRLVGVSAHPIDQSSRQLPPGGWDACLSKPVEPGALAVIVRAAILAPVTSVKSTGSLDIPMPHDGRRRGGDGGGLPT